MIRIIWGEEIKPKGYSSFEEYKKSKGTTINYFIERIDKFVESEMKTLKIHGDSLAIVKGDEA